MAQFVLKHQKTGQTYPVIQPFVIGRDKADVKFLSDDKLSRNHCKVFMDNLGFLCVEDLGATNKTWVNEVALESGSNLKLKVGDSLRVGHQVFEIQKIETEDSRLKPAGKLSKKKQAADPTLQASRGIQNTKTVRMDVKNSARIKQMVLWTVLVVIVILFVLMFLYPEEASYYIQSLGS